MTLASGLFSVIAERRLRIRPVFGLVLFLVVLSAGCRKTGGPPAPAAGDPAGIHLTDVAGERGLTFRYGHEGKSPLNIVQLMGAGAGFVDYDRDGWPDILCVSYPRPALFHNEGGGRFRDVTSRSGLPSQPCRWYGCATGDYDNDGWVDLYLTGYNRTVLLHNNGNGTFRDVTVRAGVGLHRWASSAAFADVNRDGLLDLYVGCYLEFRPGMPEFFVTHGVRLSLGPDGYEAQHGVLFLNQGNGTFRDGTRAAGLAAGHGKALGVAFADADGDGDDDLVVANDQQPLDFFENDGHGRFRNVAEENGTALNSEGRRQGGMGVDFADYDGDGRLDLFVANFADEPKSLYRNVGDGMFEHAGDRAGISQSTRPWVAFGSHFADLDNDGLPDLAITSGHVQDLVQLVDPGNSYPQRCQLFRNLGNGRFREISDQVGPDFRRPAVGRALATGDFDNDGAEDLLVADLEGPPRLYHNDGKHAGHWIALQLEGVRSNRMGIGARIVARAGGKQWLREVRTDGSYLAAQDARVLLGVGGEPTLDTIEIRWPSGARQTLRAVRADRVLKVREPGTSR